MGMKITLDMEALTELVTSIVLEVVKQLQKERCSCANTPAPVSEEVKPLSYRERVLTQTHLADLEREHRWEGKEKILYISPTCIVSPLAKDYAKDKRIDLRTSP